MKRAIRVGVVLPQPLIQKVIPQFERFSKLPPAKNNLFCSPVKNLTEEFIQVIKRNQKKYTLSSEKLKSCLHS